MKRSIDCKIGEIKLMFDWINRFDSDDPNILELTDFIKEKISEHEQRKEIYADGRPEKSIGECRVRSIFQDEDDFCGEFKPRKEN